MDKKSIILLFIAPVLFSCMGRNDNSLEERLNFFSGAPKVGKSFASIIDSLGTPDFQTGWMEYIDHTHESPYSEEMTLFEMKNVPIKAYAWKKGDTYQICYCTYKDYRFRCLPSYLICVYDTYPLTTWLSKYSGDDGFYLFKTAKTSSLETLCLNYYQKDIRWEKYSPVGSTSLHEFFESVQDFTALRDNRTLKELKGESRKSIISKVGRPYLSRIYRTSQMPLDLYSNCWFAFDSLPSLIKVDRYRYRYKLNPGRQGTVTYIYDYNVFSCRLVFAYAKDDVDFYVEY